MRRDVRFTPKSGHCQHLYEYTPLALYRQVDDRETLSAECALWQG